MKSYTYDKNGLSELRKDLVILFKNNEEYLKFSEKMCNEFIKLI